MYADFIAAQIKTLSFLAYIIRIYQVGYVFVALLLFVQQRSSRALAGKCLVGGGLESGAGEAQLETGLHFGLSQVFWERQVSVLLPMASRERLWYLIFTSRLLEEKQENFN